MAIQNVAAMFQNLNSTDFNIGALGGGV